MSRSRNCLLSRKTVKNQQLVNPIRHLPECSQSSLRDTFFRNANRCSFNQSTFTAVHGNMTVVYSGEQPSLWNKYRWVDFDQQTWRHLHTSSTGIVTIEMEPMTLSSRVKIYRIHCYRDREDIFYDHLAFVKSALARRPDIAQFLGTCIDNADGEKFIVLSGGGLSLSEVFTGSHVDLEMIKMTYSFQLMDIFSTSPFTVLDWSWSKFWDLPLFSRNHQLIVDIILLESHGLVANSKLGGKMAHRQSHIIHFYAKLQDQTLPGDIKRILDLRQDSVLLKEATERCQMVARGMFWDLWEWNEELDDEWWEWFWWKAPINSTSGIEELHNDAMHVDSLDALSTLCLASNNSTSGSGIKGTK